ncbi:hypothetical protein BJV77DRAFT_200294 [Russula vinacea]|nr:hypothetical protein BJV77DRAFT_200294 [Russula vinacea]
MSLLATPFAFLFFFSGFALAQIVSPKCESTWAWSFNSLDQDPCLVAATMLGTCTGGSFTIGPLPPGYSYLGPSSADGSNLCFCNTVEYSLTSACGGCQGRTWVTWSEFSFNCTRILPPSQFPNPVPAGMSVPNWALLDVTKENNWDFNKSVDASSGPADGYGVPAGSTPGSLSPPSNTSSTPSSTSSVPSSTSSTPSSTSNVPSSPSSTPSSPPSIRSGPSSASTSGLKAGLIASGIVGGIAAITILVVALFFCRRWRYSLTSSAVPPAPESGGDNLSAFVAFNSPMLSHTPSRASSSRGLYTIFPMSASQPHHPHG